MPIVVVPERITVKRIVLLVGAAIATVFGSLALWAGVASAWQPVIGQATDCVNDGSWTVQWTVGNSETDAGRVMTFDSATVNGVSISLTPSSVAPGASATGTSTHSSATESATLVVHARWANSTPNETASAQATVVKPECVETTTTTTTTTTVAPTATTAPEVTTTAPVVEDTAVVRESVPEVTTQAGPQVEAAQVSAAADTNTLPATGTVSAPLVLAGASLLVIGVALLVTARRHGASA